MPIRRKRNIRVNPNPPRCIHCSGVSHETDCPLYIDDATLREIEDRGPSLPIRTDRDHCYACGYHIEAGHSEECPVDIADRIIDEAEYYNEHMPKSTDFL